MTLGEEVRNERQFAALAREVGVESSIIQLATVTSSTKRPAASACDTRRTKLR